MPRSEFPGFPSEALAFLRGLERNNRREWFQPRKPVFDEKVKLPMLELVAALNADMERFAPMHVTQPESALYRIYRDTRFSNDKRPYKTHVAAWWSHQGLAKTSGAGFYFHVSAKEVVIAAGAYMPEKDQLAQIRHWLLDHHAEFRKLLHSPKVRNAFTEFEGNALTRPPKGFPADHPALDLIRCKQWGLAATLPAQAALKPDLAATVIRYFKIATPIVDALNTPIAAAQAPKKKVLFGLH